ncbi:hypothetical protein [Methylobacterium soli]|uniref:Uncharacterized protein n=1 Tax=Methylobacterium soli TaxID=553447 RepID=A0A6L3T0A0_9HYPH|nr:hypothetical protein [Methylobacterium soli]KAB1078383.1 hypothetical protein F6X53_14950 [Methylobacterium soli]GJE45301.1 hypothetical protein AEGHOMDF_4495 [Methylobacterium soli]
MKLIVTGTQDGRPVSFQRQTPDMALETALHLQDQGVAEVYITDITGRTYGPNEFAACFVRAVS